MPPSPAGRRSHWWTRSLRMSLQHNVCPYIDQRQIERDSHRVGDGVVVAERAHARGTTIAGIGGEPPEHHVRREHPRQHLLHQLGFLASLPLRTSRSPIVPVTPRFTALRSTRKRGTSLFSMHCECLDRADGRIPRSRATWAPGLPVSATIHTAPARKSVSNRRLLFPRPDHLSWFRSPRYEGKHTRRTSSAVTAWVLMGLGNHDWGRWVHPTAAKREVGCHVGRSEVAEGAL